MRFVVQDKKLSNFIIADNIIIGESWKSKKELTLFIEQLSLKLKLPKTCWATACVLFHRYVLNYAITSFNNYIVASACLFLACKIDECEIRIETLVEAYFFLFSPNTSINNNKGVIDEHNKINTINLILDKEFEIITANNFDLDIQLAFDILQDAKKLLTHNDIYMVFQKAE